MTRRRSFLIGCGGIVAAPVFARIALPPIAARASKSAALAVDASAQNVALRIDGWDTPADSGDELWVQINSSWRATWR